MSATAPRVALGYRREFTSFISRSKGLIDALEITIDNHLYGGPSVRREIRRLSDHFEFFAHGVGLSIGTDYVDTKRYRLYLSDAATTLATLNVPWYSEHLSFTKAANGDLANLLPLPRTQESIDIVKRNFRILREYVTMPVLLENVTCYFGYAADQYSEAEFLKRVTEECGCYILLDLENLRNNSLNRGYDPYVFLRSLSRGVVKAVHMAGGSVYEGLHVDSHDNPVKHETFSLLQALLTDHAPDVITLERDDRLEYFSEVSDDLKHIRSLIDRRRIA